MDRQDQFFEELLEKQKLTLTEQQRNQFAIYYDMLVQWNEKMNLTSITEKKQVYLKHFYDSISLSFFVPLNDVVTLADIGSGAGFPSIPLKIIYPHLRVTIIDSLNKRIQFLQALVEKLELVDVDCVHSRAEDAGRNELYREQFDLVTARAVARLNVLNELCLPFVKREGLFVAMKGAQGLEELEEASRSIRELNSEHVDSFNFSLPKEESLRYIILIKKTNKISKKYPRKAGVPGKNPI